MTPILSARFSMASSSRGSPPRGASWQTTSGGALVVCHEAPRGGEPRLEEAIETLADKIGVMCELKSPWRYRRHDFVGRVVELLPDDAIVVSFDARALEAVRGR